MRERHIALICDDKYALPTMVCIQSIIMTTKNPVQVHVCTFELTDDNVQRFISLSNDTVNVIVDKFEINQYREMIDRVNQKSHVTPTALIKFELSNYFSTINKLLYIDSDIIVKEDISALFDCDIEDAFLGASYEFYKYLENKKYRFKKNWDTSFYFNSGVMLLNLKLMREERISELLWDYKLNKAKTTLMDQESLIAICGTRATKLPIRWNFNPVFLDSSYINDINEIYGTAYQSIEQLLSDVAIIHYVGKKDKPWTFSTARMRQYWVDAYNNLKDVEQIAPIPDGDQVGRTGAIKDIYNKHGFEGIICYYTFRLRQKMHL